MKDNDILFCAGIILGVLVVVALVYILPLENGKGSVEQIKICQQNDFSYEKCDEIYGWGILGGKNE